MASAKATARLTTAAPLASPRSLENRNHKGASFFRRPWSVEPQNSVWREWQSTGITDGELP